MAQCYVHGESLKSCLVAVVVPNPDTLLPHAEKNLGFKSPTVAELCKSDVRIFLTFNVAVTSCFFVLKKIKKLILDDMNCEGKKAGIASFEQVK